MHELPSIPEIYLELQSLLDQNMPPIKMIARTILSDPALTLRVLAKVTLTPHFDPRNSTVTIAKVINFIGLKPIRELLNSRVIFHDEIELKNRTLFDFHQFWKHSLFAAFAAEHLAQEVRYPNPEEAYIAALVHDIGKLAIAKFSPEKAFKINKIHRSHSDYGKAEEKIIRVKHQEIGGEIAESLRLPEPVVSSIARHHDDRMLLRYKNIEKSLNLIVYVSNSISKIFCYRDHSNHYFYEGQEDANMFLDLSHASYRRIVRQVGDKIYGLIDEFHSKSEGIRHYCLSLEESCKSAGKQISKMQEMQRKIELQSMEIQTFEEILPRVSKGSEWENLILTFVKSVSAFSGFKYTAIFLYENRTSTLINKLHFGLPADEPMRWATFDPKTMSGVIVTSFNEKASHNIHRYDEKTLGKELFSLEELRFVKHFPFATIPIFSDKRSIGVLYVSHAMQDEVILDDEFEVLKKLARFIGKMINI